MLSHDLHSILRASSAVAELAKQSIVLAEPFLLLARDQAVRAMRYLDSIGITQEMIKDKAKILEHLNRPVDPDYLRLLLAPLAE